MLKIVWCGQEQSLDSEMNGFQLLKQLGGADGKNAIALKIDGELRNLSTVVADGADVEPIMVDSAEGLDILRHSTAHLMAAAVVSLFKNVKVAIGPSIENGFYYDFEVENTFSEADLLKIEEKMQEIVKRDDKFSMEEWSRQEALEFFSKTGENYKVELLQDIPEGEKITIYRLGDFVDLCRGPHVPSARYLKHFKLTKVAGAYWRGDSNNKMLQRIYGTAWDSKERLDEYFKFLEEAEKRDHRKICRTMDLAHFEPEYAPGAVFFHPNGLFIYNKLIAHMRAKQEEAGYIEVSTPRVMDRCLWERSGHWEKYGEHNYSGSTEDGKQFCIKPMNCPGGILIYKNELHSYRDLPIRMAEFGKVNRYEASGSLFGLLRVREFTQDDAHIFCTPEQVESECIATIKFILDIYKDFGFDNVIIKLSTRPEKRIGSEEIWDISEKALADALNKLGLTFTIFEGEGAFYGPKLEFVLKDCIGRDWQCGTLQLDMNLPDRFDMSYIGDDGQKHTPIMLHRALLGSIERFMGMLIENCEGKFPLWLNPVQMAIATVTDEAIPYANEVYSKLKANGFRVLLETSNDTISHKIRELSNKKIPYILTVGKQEEKDSSVNVRIFGESKTESINLNILIEKLKKKVEQQHKNYNI